jgi:putative IMPACT (imprinted ancient) family translation regulator
MEPDWWQLTLCEAQDRWAAYPSTAPGAVHACPWCVPADDTDETSERSSDDVWPSQA